MMPKKKKTAETLDERLLVTAAKAIGKAVAKAAILARVEPVPKLSKKNTGKLPRREKTAAQKSSK